MMFLYKLEEIFYYSSIIIVMLLFVNISFVIILMMHYDVLIQIKGDLPLYLYHYSDIIVC